MLEEDKRIMENRLEEKIEELSKVTNQHLDTLGQMMNIHHELNVKDIEISTLKLQNEQLQNDLRREKELNEQFNKPHEAIKYFEQLLKSLRSSSYTTGLGYTSIEEGESSKAAEERNNKSKISKPTCHYCGKKGHTANVCRNKKTYQNRKPKFMSYCQKCKKKAHQAYECRSKANKTPKFEGHCYNCQKYGHRAFEC